MRNKILALTVVTGVLCAVAAVTVNGGKDTVAQQSLTLTPANVASLTDDGAYQLLIDNVFGTGEQRRRGDELMLYRMQVATRDCMANSGYSGYPVLPYYGLAGGPEVPGDFEIAAPLSTDFGIAQRREQLARGVEAGIQAGGNPTWRAVKDNPEAAKAYGQALTKCQDPAHKLEGTDRPASQASFVSEVYQLLGKVQASDAAKPLLEKYQSCMNAAGYNIKSWRDLFIQTERQYLLPGQPWSELSQSPQWETAVAAEHKAATSDSACRRELRTWGMAQIRGGVNALLLNTALGTVYSEWNKIMSDHQEVNSQAL